MTIGLTTGGRGTGRHRRIGIALLASLPASAQAATPLALVDWGVYAAADGVREARPGNTSGVIERVQSERLLQRTTEVCARLGTMFGIRYRLSGAVPVASLPVVVEIVHLGLRDRQGGLHFVDTIPADVVAGELHWSGWIFRDPKNLVPGTQGFIVLAGGVPVLSQSFSVETDCAVPVS